MCVLAQNSPFFVRNRCEIIPLSGSFIDVSSIAYEQKDRNIYKNRAFLMQVFMGYKKQKVGCGFITVLRNRGSECCGFTSDRKYFGNMNN